MLRRLVKCLGVVWVSFAMSLGLTIPAFAAVNFGAAHYKYMEPSLTYKYRNGIRIRRWDIIMRIASRGCG